MIFSRVLRAVRNFVYCKLARFRLFTYPVIGLSRRHLYIMHDNNLNLQYKVKSVLDGWNGAIIEINFYIVENNDKSSVYILPISFSE